MPTVYRVLRRDGHGDRAPLVPIRDVESHSAAGAARAVETDPDTVSDYGYVVVPVSNWSEIGATVKTPEPQIVFEERETYPIGRPIETVEDAVVEDLSPPEERVQEDDGA